MPAPPRRRWLRFSLCTLLVLVTVVGIWLGVAFHRAREQARAVAVIQSVGGYASYDFLRGEATLGDPYAASDVPRWLLHHLGIDFFHNIVRVSFYEPATEEALKALDALPHITVLEIDRFSGTSEAFSHLRSLKKLQTLHVGRSTADTFQFDDSALAHLSRNAPLQELWLRRTSVTDRGLQYLRSFRTLETVYLEDSQVTHAGAKTLSDALPDCYICVIGGEEDEFLVDPSQRTKE